MIERVITGGQTGADQRGPRAARPGGIPTGGWAPRGWLTEAGPAPSLAEWGLAECPDGETESERYRARRRLCLKDCYAVVCFGDTTSPGSRGLDRDCQNLRKPLVHVRAGLSTPWHVAEFTRESRVSRLLDWLARNGKRTSYDRLIAYLRRSRD